MGQKAEMSKTDRIHEEIWARYQKARIWNRILSLSGLWTNHHLSWPAIFHLHSQRFGYNSSPLNSFPGFTQRAYELKWPQTSVILIPSLHIKGNGGSEKLSTAGRSASTSRQMRYFFPTGSLTTSSPIPGAPSCQRQSCPTSRWASPGPLRTSQWKQWRAFLISLIARELSAHLRPMSMAVFLPNLPVQICISSLLTFLFPL